MLLEAIWGDSVVDERSLHPFQKYVCSLSLTPKKIHISMLGRGLLDLHDEEHPHQEQSDWRREEDHVQDCALMVARVTYAVECGEM